MFLFQASKPEIHYNNQQFEDFYTAGARRVRPLPAKREMPFLLKSVRFFSRSHGGECAGLACVIFRDRDRRMGWRGSRLGLSQWLRT